MRKSVIENRNIFNLIAFRMSTFASFVTFCLSFGIRFQVNICNDTTRKFFFDTDAGHEMHFMKKTFVDFVALCSPMNKFEID